MLCRYIKYIWESGVCESLNVNIPQTESGIFLDKNSQIPPLPQKMCKLFSTDYYVKSNSKHFFTSDIF